MKKYQTLLILTAIVICLAACTKSNSTQLNASIVGKWKVIKLHISKTSNGVASDTTLNTDALSSADRVIFNADTTAVFTFGANIPYPGAPVTLWIGEIDYNYQISGSILTLIRTNLPQGQTNGVAAIKTETIIRLDNKNLVLKDAYTDGSNKISTQSYFVRE